MTSSVEARHNGVFCRREAQWIFRATSRAAVSIFGLPISITRRKLAGRSKYHRGLGSGFAVHKQQEVYVYRLLHTDSGHYLLPTDDPNQQIADEEDLVKIAIDALYKS